MLFREAMRDVKPIAARARALPCQAQTAGAARASPPPIAPWCSSKACKGFGEGEITDTGDEISFRRAGVQDGVMRKLKSGEYRVEEICDLHGLRVDEAKAALREFLAEALAHNLRCVRIIHGKGKGSGPRGPVIKTAVNMVLRKTGAGAGVHLGAPRRRRHRRHQRVAVDQSRGHAVCRHGSFSSRTCAFRRSCVAGTNHMSAPIAANSRSCIGA